VFLELDDHSHGGEFLRLSEQATGKIGRQEQMCGLMADSTNGPLCLSPIYIMSPHTPTQSSFQPAKGTTDNFGRRADIRRERKEMVVGLAEKIF